MHIKDADQIQKMYLDYVNNFLSIRGFADHYDVTMDQAGAIIATGKLIQEATAGLAKTLRDGDEAVSGETVAKAVNEHIHGTYPRRRGYEIHATGFMTDLMKDWEAMPDATKLQRQGDIDSILCDILMIRNAAM